MASDGPIHGEYEWKRFADVRNGDHVSVVKYVVSNFCYWHHGVYSTKLGCVVAFSLKKKSVGGEESFLEDTRKALLDMYSRILENTHDSHVCRQDLDYFEHHVNGKATGMVRVQRYGQESGDQVDAALHRSPYSSEVDRNNAAAVAEFFVEDGDEVDGDGDDDDDDDDVERHLAFGKYNFRKWNCECFATFCCTATFGPGELQRLIRESDDARLSEAEIRAKSRVRSVQSDKFVCHSVFPEDASGEDDLGQLGGDGTEVHEYDHREEENPKDFDESFVGWLWPIVMF